LAGSSEEIVGIVEMLFVRVGIAHHLADTKGKEPGIAMKNLHQVPA
jgi:hypothetical protein